jgi:hypothetical protein
VADCYKMRSSQWLERIFVGAAKGRPSVRPRPTATGDLAGLGPAEGSSGGRGADGRSHPGQPVAGCSRLAATRELPTAAQRIQVTPGSGRTEFEQIASCYRFPSTLRDPNRLNPPGPQRDNERSRYWHSRLPLHCMNAQCYSAIQSNWLTNAALKDGACVSLKYGQSAHLSAQYLRDIEQILPKASRYINF